MRIGPAPHRRFEPATGEGVVDWQMVARLMVIPNRRRCGPAHPSRGSTSSRERRLILTARHRNEYDGRIYYLAGTAAGLGIRAQHRRSRLPSWGPPVNSSALRRRRQVATMGAELRMLLLKKLVQLLISPLPSAIKVPIHRLPGASFAEGAGFAPLVVFVADEIDLGPHAQIKPLSIIYRPRRLRHRWGIRLAEFLPIPGLVQGDAAGAGARLRRARNGGGSRAALIIVRIRGRRARACAGPCSQPRKQGPARLEKARRAG